VVAYSNEVKTSILKVDVNVLNENGAVSQQVVEQMAVGARELLKTDYAIAISALPDRWRNRP
jgi:nicotinamide-nucleotide amidase